MHLRRGGRDGPSYLARFGGAGATGLLGQSDGHSEILRFGGTLRGHRNIVSADRTIKCERSGYYSVGGLCLAF
jgi:hypothetical protein